MSFRQLKGINAIIIISVFQLISFTGSAISGFGQMFYIWGENGKALTITFFFFVQTIS